MSRSSMKVPVDSLIALHVLSSENYNIQSLNWFCEHKLAHVITRTIDIDVTGR